MKHFEKKKILSENVRTNDVLFCVTYADIDAKSILQGDLSAKMCKSVL